MKHHVNDLYVTVAHPHGEIEVPLRDWIAAGPGERKWLSPIKLTDKDGKDVSLNHLPLKYRNNSISRLLISIGIIKKPWP
ncbi:MAG: hypothetical protein QNK37_38845 [Acidobacteriota bacterium]|nr:hypothetical protein [Acidobacteriota bacterium]